MIIAVGRAIVNAYQEKEISIIKNELVKEMQRLGRLYPYSGYGKQFKYWLREDNPKPYNSFENGSGIRISSLARLLKMLTNILKLQLQYLIITLNE